MASLALSLVTCALIVLMLIKMGALLPDGNKRGPRLTAVPLSPSASTAPAKERVAGPQPKPAGPPLPRKVALPPPRPDLPISPPAFLKISREDFAAADISKMTRSSGSGESGPAQSSASAYGPGEGPGGAKLYNAEWYREPTRAEIATYMPKRDFGSGWATIACRTEERNRVTDCRELAESPPGSGLSRAMRQAAWQFLVRPPRIDGRAVIGAWVRIRFDFTQTPGGGETPPASGSGN